MGVVVRRYIDNLTIIIIFPYSTSIIAAELSVFFALFSRLSLGI